jgi:hypothetical protein
MTIDKNYPGLRKEENRYELEGTIETSESIGIDLDMGLFVGKSIKAGGSIESDMDIEVGESIKSGKDIEVRGSIKAGSDIKARQFIESGGNVISGGVIEAELGAINVSGFIESRNSIKAE